MDPPETIHHLGTTEKSLCCYLGATICAMHRGGLLFSPALAKSKKSFFRLIDLNLKIIFVICNIGNSIKIKVSAETIKSIAN